MMGNTGYHPQKNRRIKCEAFQKPELPKDSREKYKYFSDYTK